MEVFVRERPVSASAAVRPRARPEMRGDLGSCLLAFRPGTGPARLAEPYARDRNARLTRHLSDDRMQDGVERTLFGNGKNNVGEASQIHGDNPFGISQSCCE